MRKRKLIMLFVACGLVLLMATLFSERREPEKNQVEPIVIAVHGSLETMTVDDLIAKSELIIIGKVDTIQPSKCKVPSGKIPENLTVSVILDNDMSIVTDHLISIDKILKGDYKDQVIRVRAFAGEIDQIRFKSSSQPSYKLNQLYLLFLIEDHGPTQIVDPGDFIPVNAIDAVYEIGNGKAFSIDDEWLLDDLIAYIEKSLSSETPVSTEPSALPTETLLPPTETPIFTEAPTSTP